MEEATEACETRLSRADAGSVTLNGGLGDREEQSRLQFGRSVEAAIEGL